MQDEQLVSNLRNKGRFSRLSALKKLAASEDFKPEQNRKATINRHRDFSFFLDSGAAFIVTPLL